MEESWMVYLKILYKILGHYSFGHHQQSRFPANLQNCGKYKKRFHWSSKALRLQWTNQCSRFIAFSKAAWKAKDSGVQASLSRRVCGQERLLCYIYMHGHLHTHIFPGLGALFGRGKHVAFLCHVSIEMPWNHTQRDVRRYGNAQCIDSILTRRV